MPTFFQMILSTLFISLCPHSFSDGSLSTKQIVFLQRPVLGRKRRESKVRDLTFLLCISWQIGVFSHQSFCQLLNVYPRPTSPSATSNPAAVFVLGKPNTHTHTAPDKCEWTPLCLRYQEFFNRRMLFGEAGLVMLPRRP